MLRVETLSHNDFAGCCNQLRDRILSRHGQWDLLVGIATGGDYVADYFEKSGIPRISIRKRRTYSASKEKGHIDRWLRRLPLAVCDVLRRCESVASGVKSKVGKTFHIYPKETAVKLSAPAEERLARLSETLGRCPFVLIVDDAADSGHTLKAVREAVERALPGAKTVTAVLVTTRPEARCQVTESLYDDGRLLRFPWAADFR